MKKSLIAILLILLLPGCIQIQINIGSTPNNVSVRKTQIGTKSTEMSGANLEDIAEGLKQSGEATIPSPGGLP